MEKSNDAKTVELLAEVISLWDFQEGLWQKNLQKIGRDGYSSIYDLDTIERAMQLIAAEYERNNKIKISVHVYNKLIDMKLLKGELV